MGAVTNSNYLDNSGFAGRPVDSIFKYAGDGGDGDPGKITYPIFTLNTCMQAHGLSQTFSRKVMPVMVVYTAEMSAGVSLSDFDDSANVLSKHFVNLMIEAATIQSFKTDTNSYPGSIVLNPDLLGMVQQQSLWTFEGNGALNTATIQVMNAVQKAYWFLTTRHNWALDMGGGNVINVNSMTPIEFILHVKSGGLNAQGIYSPWEIKTQWETAASNLLSTAPNDLQADIPSFGNHFKGWIQANNWIIRHFGPDVSFGWQSNVWSNGNANWVHQDLTEQQIDDSQAAPVAQLWGALGVYDGDYAPHFLVFDKYERDAIQAAAIGYFWNQRDLKNFLSFVGLVSNHMDNIPVMLWQIPGGHLQTATGDVDLRNDNCSTECDFFFGNTLAASDMSNLKAYILSTVLPTGIYGTASIATYLTQDSQDWSKSHLALARDLNVFAILWGGGSTTSVGSIFTDDGGYLANQIKEYYEAPVYLNEEPE